MFNKRFSSSHTQYLCTFAFLQLFVYWAHYTVSRLLQISLIQYKRDNGHIKDSGKDSNIKMMKNHMYTP